MSRFPKIEILLELAKLKIALPVALSCFLGYILYTPYFSINTLFVTIGILGIVSGASTLNQIQEAYQDGLMQRTKLRPLPSGRISKEHALIWGIICLVPGMLFLVIGGNVDSLSLALFSLICYNLIYTPIKKRTPFAIVPGALCGAFPPLIGWLAAGGPLFDQTILAITIFFFMGQIPHFGLLSLIHEEDYSNAGFKTLSQQFGHVKTKHITMIWIISTIAIATLLPLYKIINTPLSIIFLLIISIWMGHRSIIFTYNKTNSSTLLRQFIYLNYFFLLVMLIIILEHLFIWGDNLPATGQISIYNLTLYKQ